MDEDDTFRILSRPSFEEIDDIFYKWLRHDTTTFTIKNYKERERFLEQHGWTYAEYVNYVS